MEADGGLGYLAIAYGVFFLALFTYVMRLRARDSEMSHQLSELFDEKGAN